jgi:two-component sensor histidine kinase
VFTYFNEAEPQIVEGLVVPLYDTGKRPLGTLWVTSHIGPGRFDPTDVRVLEQLAVQLVLAIKLRRKAEILAKLEETAKDNEVLVHEVRHRVKNMIQMTSGLLHLQERGASSQEAKTALREAQNRLLVLSGVYDSLLHPGADRRQVDAAALIAALVEALRDSSARRADVAVEIECDALLLPVMDAVPVGLIVNEAVTNALKYAFVQNEGRIAVQLKTEAGRASLMISDDGCGFAHRPREGSLGMRLMRRLAQQIGGKLEVDGSDGTTVQLTWKPERSDTAAEPGWAQD